MTSRADDLIARMALTVGDRRVSRLLSALAEAPDYGSAASFLLSELSAMADGAPGVLLRFVPSQEALVLVDHVHIRADDVRQLPAMIEEATHPLMVCALALTPVVRESSREARVGRFGPIHDWTALPMPQPHYRGAPAPMADPQAESLLRSAGARLIPLEERSFNAAPGGVLLLAGVVNVEVARSLADVSMMAGSIRLTYIPKGLTSWASPSPNPSCANFDAQ